MGSDSVENMAKFWFAYKTNKVGVKAQKIVIANAYPIILALINLLFVLCYISFLILEGQSQFMPYLRTIYILMPLIWFSNFGFSVFASPIALRFQVFPVLIFLSMSLLLLEYIWKAAFTKEVNQSIKSVAQQ